MIFLSKCLAGFPCRMDGKSKGVAPLKALYEAGEAVCACPEELGGLPTPRDPGEIREGRVITCRGADVTEAYRRGARAALEICRQAGCTMAVLKSKSPSCGKGVIHNGRFDGGLVPGDGVCARLFIDEGIPVMTEEEWLGGSGCAQPPSAVNPVEGPSTGA